jgi:hypothetical protein
MQGSDVSAAYRLRFFFEAGAGVCLWGQDEATKERFGYAVELDSLSLPSDLDAAFVQLMADYDATIDWDDPGRAGDLDTGPTTFGFETDAPFRDRVIALLPRLRAALGSCFEVESDYET